MWVNISRFEEVVGSLLVDALVVAIHMAGPYCLEIGVPGILLYYAFPGIVGVKSDIQPIIRFQCKRIHGMFGFVGHGTGRDWLDDSKNEHS